MTPTKLRVLEAAVELLGTEGLRALTHARVDAQAGVPKGSTSNYFRTRAQLLIGVSDWIGERDLADASAAAAMPQSADELVEMMCGLIEMVTGPNRTRTAARLTLFMEANHDARIRTQVSRARSAMESSVIAAMSRLGAHDPIVGSQAVMACAEGVILHRIARHDDTDPRPILALVISAALP